MYQLLTLLNGAICAVMIAINGTLTNHYGLFTATVIIHIVGTLFSLGILLVRRDKIRPPKGLPLWMYLGGAIGLLTSLSNNFCIGKISITSILALGLFGQAVTALVIDRTGLLGMEKRPFRPSSLVGVAFALAGIVFMLDFGEHSALWAILVATGGGVSGVFSRTVNARLSYHVGALDGSFINHLVGLPLSILAMVILGRSEVFPGFFPQVWMYIGGTMGVATVLLLNVVVPKLPAFQVTMLTFAAEVFAGVAMDLLVGTDISGKTFIGGLIVAAGMGLNMVLERLDERRALQNQKAG